MNAIVERVEKVLREAAEVKDKAKGEAAQVPGPTALHSSTLDHTACFCACVCAGCLYVQGVCMCTVDVCAG